MSMYICQKWLDRTVAASKTTESVREKSREKID